MAQPNPLNNPIQDKAKIALQTLKNSKLEQLGTFDLLQLVHDASDDSFDYDTEKGVFSWSICNSETFESATLREMLIEAADYLCMADWDEK